MDQRKNLAYLTYRAFVFEYQCNTIFNQNWTIIKFWKYKLVQCWIPLFIVYYWMQIDTNILWLVDVSAAAYTRKKRQIYIHQSIE